MVNIIVGGCGFIGTKLSQELLNMNEKVISIDDLSNSLSRRISSPNYSLIISSINDSKIVIQLKKSIKDLGATNEPITIWHMAANSDIKLSVKNPELEIEKTLETTISITNIIEFFNVRKVIFASSSAVYGYKPNEKLFESNSICFPISNYGIFKLASEFTLINYSNLNQIELVILRFPNVVGFPTTHGILFDLFNKILNGDKQIKILGNGSQKKQYIHVNNLIECMLFINNIKFLKYEIINISPDDSGLQVKEITNLINEVLKLKIQFVYGSEDRGWVGDVPHYELSNTKLKNLGWEKELNSKEELISALYDFLRISHTFS